MKDSLRQKILKKNMKMTEDLLEKGTQMLAIKHTSATSFFFLKRLD